jgi:hypothetical protein
VRSTAAAGAAKVLQLSLYSASCKMLLLVLVTNTSQQVALVLSSKHDQKLHASTTKKYIMSLEIEQKAINKMSSKREREREREGDFILMKNNVMNNSKERDTMCRPG